ncbi:MAG TPA: hypothetical protein VIR77_03845 [Pontiella sp.]
MKKAIQLVLLCALIPMAGMAREETLEERKKRIMRKYLREAGELSQVDWTVPDSSEEALVTESEKYQTVDVEFERHEGAMIPPVMARRGPVPSRDEGRSDGALDEDLPEDPYADPFAVAQEDEEDENVFRRPERPERPGQRENRSASDLFSASKKRFESRLDTSRNYRTIQSIPANQSLQTRQSDPVDREDLYDRLKSKDTDPSPLQFLRTYGSSPDEGMLLPTPSYRKDSGQEDRLRRGRIPFKYRRLTTENEELQSGQSSSSSYRRHTEPLPYQQLKSREKAWDPTADDAYVDELKYKVHQ